jgi:uncharacterized protein
MLAREGLMERKDWLLLTLNAAGAPGLTPAQLQKSIFLLDKEMPGTFDADRYSFSAYNYGPFSKQIYEDVEFLASRGLARITRSPGQNYFEYGVTAEGAALAARLRERANPASLAYVESVVNWAKKMTFSGLVRAIYSKYPEYRANSVFQD